MQQLSLFDFGDETPKQEKKKQPSQKDTSPSKQAGTSDASEKDEIQHLDADSVPTVPDQITNEDPSDSANDQASETGQSEERFDEDIEQESSIQETSQGNSQLEAKEQGDSEGIPLQESPTLASVSNPVTPKTENEEQLAQSEENAIEHDANSTQNSRETDSSNKIDIPASSSETDSAPEASEVAPKAPPIINKDIVFSDDSIIVKFKPKANSNTIQGADASVETASQDNLSIESTTSDDEKGSQPLKIQEKPENNESIHPHKDKVEEIDTSFPPQSEQETVNQPKEKEGDEPEDATKVATPQETENSDSQTATSHSNTQNQEDSEHTDSDPNAGQAPKLETPEPSLQKEAEVIPHNQAHTGNIPDGDNDEPSEANRNVPQADETEQVVEKEQTSPVPPSRIYESTNSDTEPSIKNNNDSIDFNLAEEQEMENEPVKEGVDEKLAPPVISHKRGRKSFKEIDAEVDLIDVPSDEELFKKQYYPISVVAKWFRVNNSLLRFWENEFKILKPKKNKKGDRFFRPEDIKNLQIIYYLLRQKKLTINGAVKHLKSKKEHTEVNLQIIQSLSEFKGFLLELRATTEK